MDMQRETAKKHNTIMDGRDIGTVVLPDADVKIFLTASAEKRAQRRYDELRAQGLACSYEEVLADINRRDANDSTRDAAPLTVAEGAIVLDTTELTLRESVDKLCGIIGKNTRGEGGKR
jgi:cytidylate kinase